MANHEVVDLKIRIERKKRIIQMSAKYGVNDKYSSRELARLEKKLQETLNQNEPKK
jgi:hypothetical protein